MVNKILFFSMLFIAIAGCEDKGPIKNIPKCVASKVEGFLPACPASAIDEYYFQDEFVYVFDDQMCCCDYQGVVVNSQCDTLGYLGGFAGQTVINNEDFSKAVFQRTIWP